MDVKPPRARPRAARRKPRGRFHHGDLAEAAIAAASAEIDRHGHLALSLRAVAARLGVTQPALYRHFPSKGALLDEIGLRGFARFVDEVAAAAGAAANPFAALRAIGGAYVRFAHAHPGWFRLWFSRVNNERYGAGAHPSFAARVAPLGERAHAVLRGPLARFLPPGDPVIDDVYRATWACAHGVAVFVADRVFQRVRTDEERIAAADAAIAVHVDALRARWAPEA